jgi:hypothetical protein
VTAALKNKTFEEIMNMWGRELEDQTITFRKQALELSKWDKMLLDNSGKVRTRFLETRSCVCRVCVFLPFYVVCVVVLTHPLKQQIIALHGSVKKVEVAQKTLDSNLEIISRQQDELHQLVRATLPLPPSMTRHTAHEPP